MAVFKDNWNGYEGKKWRVQIRYVDWQGKKREHNKRGLATKKEALEYEREFLAKKSRDINMAFGTFIDQYLEDLKPQIKLNTYHTKVHIINTHIRPYFADKSLSDISSTDILQWQNELLSKRDKNDNKDSGRMCAHNVISFHKDEKITLQEALEFGKEFAEKWFEGFQTLVAVHKDREHIHIHFVTNTVSFQDGYKLHTTKQDLEKMKQLTNQMCREKGLSVAVKGKNFYGESLEEGTVSSWSKDEYNLLKNDTKDSFLASCAIAYLEVISDCRS